MEQPTLYDGQALRNKVYRSIEEPIRKDLPWHQRWAADDHGLMTCWEVGRKLRIAEPSLAEQAIKGGLPILGWKGGVEIVTKNKLMYGMYGTYFYLAEWQGLRNDDLNIDLSTEFQWTCARTGITVTFTSDVKKLGKRPDKGK